MTILARTLSGPRGEPEGSPQDRYSTPVLTVVARTLAGPRGEPEGSPHDRCLDARTDGRGADLCEVREASLKARPTIGTRRLTVARTLAGPRGEPERLALRSMT